MAAPHSLYDPPDHRVSAAGAAPSQHRHGRVIGLGRHVELGRDPQTAAASPTPLGQLEWLVAPTPDSETSDTGEGGGPTVRALRMAGEAAVPIGALPNAGEMPEWPRGASPWPNATTPAGRRPKPAFPPPRSRDDAAWGDRLKISVASGRDRNAVGRVPGDFRAQDRPPAAFGFTTV